MNQKRRFEAESVLKENLENHNKNKLIKRPSLSMALERLKKKITRQQRITKSLNTFHHAERSGKLFIPPLVRPCRNERTAVT